MYDKKYQGWIGKSMELRVSIRRKVLDQTRQSRGHEVGTRICFGLISGDEK